MKKTIFSIFAVALIVIAFASGLVSRSAVAPESAPQLPLAEESSNQSSDTIVINAYETPYSMDDLMNDSTLVVRGTVESADVLTISGVNGGEQTVTDYNIKVSETLRGSTEDSVSVRRIGNPKNSKMIFESEPVLEQGKEYLLFLQTRNVGGDFNTAEEHYFILGGKQGVFKEDPAQEEAFAAEWRAGTKSAAEEADAVTPYSEIKAELQNKNVETPVNPDLFKETYLASLQNNLETGFLTQQEYDKAMESIDQYAEITARESLW